MSTDNQDCAMKDTIPVPKCESVHNTDSTEHNLVVHMEKHISRNNMYICYYCGFEASLKHTLIVHMKKHTPKSYMHTQSNRICRKGKSLDNRLVKEDHISLIDPNKYKLRNRKPRTCTHCDAELKYDDTKLIDSVTKQSQECIECYYKKTHTQDLNEQVSHMYKTYICRHCKGTFNSKRMLNDHIVKRHPDLIETVAAKIHECTRCAYKTTIKHFFTRHLSQHLDSSLAPKLFICIWCSVTFGDKVILNNHIHKCHPNVFPYECTKCPFKALTRQDFEQHMSEHGIYFYDNLKTCLQCGETFKRNIALDNHILKNHPNFIATISSKIYECIECYVKTPYKGSFKAHLLTHSEPTPSHDPSIVCSIVKQE
ncbi:unnamed protein product [Callosobruchus maculatus]|uniref:C2H2-type domain-containing protein n=1 Tax=Callosobruchus maculatus TaxID=64391 RepID=A0A653CGG1_CALMS|nr:unnamed protein product [Callosobruchus maculatus]